MRVARTNAGGVCGYCLETPSGGANVSTDAASPDHGGIGLFPGMTWDAYFSLVAVNHSTLEAYAPPRTPAHALYRLLRPSPSTPAQLAGQAVHCAILEPDRYEATYRVGPAVSRRTKAGRPA